MHTVKGRTPLLLFGKKGKVAKKRSHEGTHKAATDEPSTRTTTTTKSTSMAEPEDELEREFGVVAVCPAGRKILADMLTMRRQCEAEEAAEAESEAAVVGQSSRQWHQRKMAL